MPKHYKEVRARIDPKAHANAVKVCEHYGITLTVLVERLLARSDLWDLWEEETVGKRPGKFQS